MPKSGILSRFSMLLGIIAHGLAQGMGSTKEVSKARKELHYMGGGGNPEFSPRRTRFKGWQRENRKYNSKHFRS